MAGESYRQPEKVKAGSPTRNTKSQDLVLRKKAVAAIVKVEKFLSPLYDDDGVRIIMKDISALHSK